MELILDTKDACFICLQLLTSANLEPGVNETRLKNICRFLKINSSSVLLQGLREHVEGKKDASNLLQNLECNFSVNLCNHCYGVTSKLSALIQDLEVVQLEVDYYVQVFREILKRDDVTNEKEKDLVSFVESADARVVQQLKTEIINKCTDHVTAVVASRLPVVRMKRLREEMIKKYSAPAAMATEQYPGDYFTSGYTPYKDSEKTACGQEYVDTNLTLEVPVSVSADELPPSLSGPFQLHADAVKTEDITKELFVPPSFLDNTTKYMSQCYRTILNSQCSRDASVTQLKCGFCGKLIVKSNMRRHLCCMHPEKLLGSQIQMDVTDELFTVLCHRVILTETGKCSRLFIQSKEGRGQQPRDYYICHICQRRLCDRRILRDHLVMCHADILVKRLDECQNDKNKMHVPTGSKKRKRKDFGVTCLAAGCGQAFTSQRELLQHKRTKHNNTSTIRTVASVSKIRKTRRQFGKLKKRTRDLKTGSICLHCGKSFKGPYKRFIHTVRLHPEQVLISSKKSGQRLSSFRESCSKLLRAEFLNCKKETVGQVKILKCLYCTSGHRFKIDFLCHLVKVHEHVLRAKLNTPEERTTPVRLSTTYTRSTDKVEEAVDKSGHFPPGEPPSQNISTPRVLPPMPSRYNPLVNHKLTIKKTKLRWKKSGGRRSGQKQYHKLVPCLHCPRTISTNKKRHHMLRHHLEQLFIGVRPVNSSMDEFGDSCKKILHEETKTCKVQKVGQFTVYLCSYCRVSYRSKIDLQCHLVYRHTDILTGKIKTLGNQQHEEFFINANPSSAEYDDLVEEEVSNDPKVFNKNRKVNFTAGQEMMPNEMDRWNALGITATEEAHESENYSVIEAKYTTLLEDQMMNEGYHDGGNVAPVAYYSSHNGGVNNILGGDHLDITTESSLVICKTEDM